MSDDRLVLRPTWSNRLAGTYVASAIAVVLVTIGLAWMSGWVRILIVSLGASVAISVLLRWLLRSIRVHRDVVVYRADLRSIPVPIAGVAGFSARPVAYARAYGRGVAILPDRPLPHLPDVLVTERSAERFERWLADHHPNVVVNPTGTWRDRFDHWHVDGDVADPYGILTVGFRPAFVGSAAIEIERVTDGYRAVRRPADGSDVMEAGDVRAARRDAVADGVDMYRRIAAADR